MATLQPLTLRYSARARAQPTPPKCHPAGRSAGGRLGYFPAKSTRRLADQAASSHEYELGWMAINELIRSDATWSGYERNILYANNGDGTFADVTAAAGLDFIEDSRSFALADIDHDGRLELVLKNRNSPQLRILKNVAKAIPPSIVFRLQGTKSNPDAVGAAVTIESGSRTQTQTVRVGSGFLSQHSKEIFFGLGEHQGRVRAAIHWPSGLVQQLTDLPVNHRIWLQEGKQPLRLEPFRNPAPLPAVASGRSPTMNIIAPSDGECSTFKAWPDELSSPASRRRLSS